MNIRWIFFDVGYTLVNEDAVWQRRFEEQSQTAQALKLGLTPEVIRREVERSSRERKPQYRSFIQKYSLAPSAPYRHELETPYPEAKEVLRALSDRFQLGIIANQTAGLDERLSHWGLLPYLSLVVSSWEQQVMKPDPRLFEIALQKADCPGCEAVMVGDRLDNDIQPAKALGMHTVRILQGFGTLQHPSSELDAPDFTIARLSELMALF